MSTESRKTYPVRLGASLQEGAEEDCEVYEFPADVPDYSGQNGTLMASNGKKIYVVGDDRYALGEKDSKEDQCLLLFDKDTESFVLEKASAVQKLEKETKSARPRSSLYELALGNPADALGKLGGKTNLAYVPGSGGRGRGKGSVPKVMKAPTSSKADDDEEDGNDDDASTDSDEHENEDEDDAQDEQPKIKRQAIGDTPDGSEDDDVNEYPVYTA